MRERSEIGDIFQVIRTAREYARIKPIKEILPRPPSYNFSAEAPVATEAELSE